MKKVISYALFGYNTKYAEFVPAVVAAHMDIFPASEGWVLRIHHDDNLFHTNYGALLHTLLGQGVELQYMPGDLLCKAMLWRMAPIFDPTVDVTFCRDIDALPMPRDKQCMEDFIETDAEIHTIHDSPYHDGIMGGLSGFKRSVGEKIGSLQNIYAMAGAVNWAKHGTDQDVLNKHIAPKFKLCQHGGKPNSKAFVQIDLPAKSDARDMLAAHLGSAGFDHEEAYVFYDAPFDHVLMATGEDGHSDYRVILSSDTKPMYSFFVPLTCAMWKAHGYLPTVFLTGYPEDWLADRQLSLVLRNARALGAEIHFVGSSDQFDSSTVAQCARLFGAHAPGVTPDQELITSDIDMWPLGKWVGGAASGDARVQIYYANAYKHESRTHYPMCYIQATAKTWREILGAKTLGDVLDECKSARPEGSQESWWNWNFDEWYLSKKLTEWSGYPNDCQFINRDFSFGQQRIDRSNWTVPVLVDGVADAHLIRPGFTDENWPRLKPLLDARLGGLSEWADRFREEYVDG